MNPDLALMIATVVSVLTTGGAAAALHHLGSDQRHNKNHRRQLSAHRLTTGSKIGLLCASVLIFSIATVAFYRVWTEGVLSGLDELAVMLAGLVAVVMLISAWMVFWTAFCDGSPERDDLAFYGRIVRRHLRRKSGYELEIKRIEQKIAAIDGRQSWPGNS